MARSNEMPQLAEQVLKEKQYLKPPKTAMQEWSAQLEAREQTIERREEEYGAREINVAEQANCPLKVMRHKKQRSYCLCFTV